jgi:hypothetical protein
MKAAPCGAAKFVICRPGYSAGSTDAAMKAAPCGAAKDAGLSLNGIKAAMKAPMWKANATADQRAAMKAAPCGAAKPTSVCHRVTEP